MRNYCAGQALNVTATEFITEYCILYKLDYDSLKLYFIKIARVIDIYEQDQHKLDYTFYKLDMFVNIVIKPEKD